jgi:hypothetical protein
MAQISQNFIVVFKKTNQIFIQLFSIVLISTLFISNPQLTILALDNEMAKEQVEKIEKAKSEFEETKTKESKLEEKLEVKNTTETSKTKALKLFSEKIVESKGIKTIFTPDTEIKAGDGSEVKEADLTVKEISTSEISAPEKESIKLVVKAGVEGKHVEFSKPVKIEVPVSDLEEGKEVTIKVQHEGSSIWTTDAISQISDSNCTNGVSNNQNNVSAVTASKITFYTCGASTFSITPSAGTAVILTPPSGSTINPNTTFTGTGSTNGAVINLTIPPSTTVIGTATVKNGQWSITPSTPLPLGANTVCIGAATSCGNFTVSAASVLEALSCGKVYGTTFISGGTTGATQVVQYDPVTDTKVTLPFSLSVAFGKTRASALSPNGTIITYYDDADTRFESYNTVTGLTTTGPATAMAGIPNTAFNRLGYNSIGELYSLVTIAAAPSSTYLIKVDPVSLAATNLGVLTDKAGNAVSVSALGGGDLIFDNVDKGYLIDNNGYFFKIDISTRVATFLATAPATTPAGLAYGPNGLIYTFTSATPNGNIYAIDLAANTISLMETQIGTVFADAFGCAYPDIAPKPSAGKTPAIVTGAAANGTGGTVSTTPATVLSPGDLVQYSVVLRNGGITAGTNSKYQDTLPSGTTYIAGSTKMNTVAVTDGAGSTFPYTVAKLVNSPGAAAGVVSADLTPAITTDKEVTITYRVRISDPFTATPRQISNQGTFTSDDFATIRTDDPSTTTPGDATVTPIGGGISAVDDIYATTGITPVTLTPLTGDTAGTTIKSINGTLLTPGTAQSITIAVQGVVNIDAAGVIKFTPLSTFTGLASFPYVIKDAAGNTATANEKITVSAAVPASCSLIPKAINWTLLGATPATVASASGQTFTNVGPILGIPELNGVNITLKYTFDGTGQNDFRLNGLKIDGTSGSFTGTNYYAFDGAVTMTLSSPFVMSTNASSGINAGETNSWGPTTVGALNVIPTNAGLVANEDSINNPTGASIAFASPVWKTSAPTNQIITIVDAGNGVSTLNEVYIVNCPITATNDNYTVFGGEQTLINPLNGDTAGTTIKSINGVAITPGVAQNIPTAHGFVTVSSGGNVFYTANSSYSGTETFPYVIQNTAGQTATANETIVVKLALCGVEKIFISDEFSIPGGGNPDGATFNTSIPTQYISFSATTPTPADFAGAPIFLGAVYEGGTITVNGVVNSTVTSLWLYSNQTVQGKNVKTIQSVSFGYPMSGGIPLVSIDGSQFEAGYKEFYDGGGGVGNYFGYFIPKAPCPPKAVDDSYTTTIGSPKILTPLANDTDPDTATPTITNINGTAILPNTAYTIPVTGGTVTVSTAGVVTFNPAPGFIGASTFPYTISDGTTTSTAKETITTTPAANSVCNNIVDNGLFTTDIAAWNPTPATGAWVWNNGTAAFTADAALNSTISQNISGFAINGGYTTFKIILQPAEANNTLTEKAVLRISFGGLPYLTITNPIGTGDVTYVTANGSSYSVDTTVRNQEATIYLTVPAADALPKLLEFKHTSGKDDWYINSVESLICTTPAANLPPVAVNDNYTTTPGASKIITPLLGDTDPDGNTLTITSINGVTLTPGVAQRINLPSGFVDISTTGVITFQDIAGRFYQPIVFPYTISDGNGGTATANETIIVSIPPQAIPDSYHTLINAPIVIDPIANDYDLNTTDTIKITKIGTTVLTPGGTAQTGIVVPNGTVSVSATGVITFTPATGYTGIATFPYTIADSTGKTANSTVKIKIDNQTDPCIGGSLIQLYQDSVYSGNGSGPNISYIITVGSSTPTPYITGTPGSTTPPAGLASAFASAPTVGVGLDLKTVMSVGDTKWFYNQGPTLYNTGHTVKWYMLVTRDGIFDYTTKAWAQVDNNTPVPVDLVTSDTGFDGSTQMGGYAYYYDFAYTVGACGPTATDDNYTTTGTTPVTLTPLTGDTAGTTIKSINGIILTGAAQSIPVPNGTVNIGTTGTIVFIPNTGYSGDATFPYVIQDASGNTATANEKITVSLPTPPTATNDVYTTNINTPKIITPLTGDTGTGITIKSINGTLLTLGTAQTGIVVPNGTVDVSAAGVITFNPTTGFTGNSTFPYIITDTSGQLTSANQVINIIKAVNDTKTTPAGTPITYNPLANDTVPAGSFITAINGTPITVIPFNTPISVPNGTVVLNNDGTITFTPAAGYTGTSSFPYEVTTPDGTKVTATDTITIIKAVDDVTTTLINTPKTYNPLSNDLSLPTGSAISLINGVVPVVGTPIPVTGGTVTLNSDGTITVTPTTGSVVPVTFPYQVTTPDGTKVTANDTISIENPKIEIDKKGKYNDTNGNASGDVGETVTFTFIVKNIGNVTLTNITLADAALTALGETIVGGPITSLLPNGIDSTTFTATHTVTIADISAGYFTNSATASGTPPNGPVVTAVSNDPNTPAVNDPTKTLIPPFAFPDVKSTPINTSVTYNPLANDIVPSGSSVGTINGVTPVVGTPIPVPNGTATLNADGTITFAPTTGFVGQSSFPYTVNTIAGPYASINTINVYKANDDTKTTVAGQPITYSPLTNDNVPAGSTITKINGVTPVVGTPIPVTGGTVTLNSDGTITVTPTPGSTAPVTFPYEVTTPEGTKVTANDTITVIKAVDDTKVTNFNSPISYNPLTNDVNIPIGSTITKINGVTPVVGTPIPVPGGTVTLNNDGTITVAPTPDSTAPVTFPYEVTTPDGTKVTANDTVTVIKANDDIKTTPAGQPITYNPISNDTNIQAGSTITKINGVTPVVGTPIPVPGGTVTLNADGTITVTPTPGSTDPVTFPYEVTTPDGTKVTANDTVTVIKANDDIKTIITGTPTTYDPKANDVNIPAGSTITKINGVTPVVATPIPVTGGTVTLNADGTITVTPTPGSTAPVTFPYEVTTPDGTKVTANDTINQVNATNDTKTTPAGVPVSYNPLANDNIPAGSTITKINGVTPVVGTPIPVPGGTVTLNADGTFTVTPTPGFVGDIIFPYEVTTPDGTKVTATDTIMVTNQPPVAIDDSYTTTVGVPVVLTPLASDTDADGNLIKVTQIGTTVITPGTAQTIPVTNGTVTISATGVIVFTPAPGFVGTATIPYTISDGNGGTATANELVTIPQIATLELDKAAQYNDLNGNFSGDVNETISYTFKVKNTGNVPLTNVTISDPSVTIIGGPIATLAVGATDTATFTATHVVTAGDISAGSFTNTATASGTPPVGPVVTDISNDPNTPAANDPTVTPIPPYAFPDIKGTPINTSVTYNPLTNDILPSGSVLKLINGESPIVGTPILVTNGSVVLNADGTITVTPDNGFTGTITFPYVVNTIAGDYNSVDTINVYKAVDETMTTPAGTPVTYNPLANDVVPSGSVITKIGTTPVVIGTPITIPNGTVTVNADGSITVTPNPGYSGTLTFPYEVTTPDGVKVTANDTVNVVSAVNDTKTTPAGTPVTYNPLTNDTLTPGTAITAINGTPIAVITPGTSIPVTGGTVTVNLDGTITVTPTPGSTAPISFVYEVTTLDGVKVTATDTITVIKAVDDNKTTIAGQPVTYNPLANDVNIPAGSTITQINGITPVVGTPITIPNGTVTLNSDGTFTVTPDVGYTGTLSFPYQVTTPDGVKVTATTNIEVIKAINDTLTTPVGTPVTYDPLDNDSIPTGSTITKINGVTPVVGTPITVPGGTVTLNADGTITVTPTLGSTTPIIFPYEVTTPDGTKVTATDTVTPIKAVDDLKTTPVGTPITYNPLTNDINIPTGSTITAINGTPVVIGVPVVIPNATVVVNLDGTITVTPSPLYTGPISFPYTVTAPGGIQVTAVDTITVIKAVNDNKTTPAGTPISYNPLTNDNIPVGSAITKIGTTPVVIGTPIPVPGGTVTVNADGTITVTPTPGSTTPIVFVYEVTTPDGTKVSATDTVTPIKAVDDLKTTPKDTPVIYNPLDNDSVPTGSTITKINGVTPVIGTPIPVPGGTVTLNADGTIKVTPTPGSTVPVTFPYEVTTPDGTKVTANESIISQKVEIDKKIFKGHSAGAGCETAVDELVIVDKNRAPQPITWCFTIKNTGTTSISNISIDDTTLGITQSSMTLLSGAAVLAPGAIQVWYYQMTTIDSITNDATVKAKSTDSAGVPLGLPEITAHDTGGAKLIYVYDPPFGVKTGTYQGSDIVRWTMVWINTAPVTANNAEIIDEIPAGTTFNDGLVCTGAGVTVVISCTFESPSAQYPRGRIRVLANIGPDVGGTTAEDSENELQISFDNLVAPNTSDISNQAQLNWEGFEVPTKDPVKGGTTKVIIPKGIAALLRTGGASENYGLYAALSFIAAGLALAMIAKRKLEK